MIRDIEKRILFEDNHCLVVDKPAGVVCAGSADGPETLEAQIKNFLKEKYNKPGNVYLTLVHRIDRPTSGCVLLAKTSKAASRLSESFRTNDVHKIYLAKVSGKVSPDHGEWIDYLVVDESARKTKSVNKNHPDAQKAILNYKILQKSDISELEIELKTGRKHQIRAQCAERGFPIVGDKKYGSSLKIADAAILLHSWKISFTHPTKEARIEVSAPLPNYWKDFSSST